LPPPYSTAISNPLLPFSPLHHASLPAYSTPLPPASLDPYSNPLAPNPLPPPADHSLTTSYALLPSAANTVFSAPNGTALTPSAVSAALGNPLSQVPPSQLPFTAATATPPAHPLEACCAPPLAANTVAAATTAAPVVPGLFHTISR